MSLRRRLLLAGAVLLGALLLVGGWLGLRVWQAAGAARDLQTAVAGAGAELDALDASALAARLPDVQDAAARLRSAATDPVWSVATHLPWVGDDLTAVRAVAVAADDLARDAAPGLLDALGTIGAEQDDQDGQDTADGTDATAGTPDATGTATTGTASTATSTIPDGWIDLSVLVDAAPSVQRAAEIAEDLRAALAPIDADSLVGPLADPVAQAQGLLDADTLSAVREVAAVLPTLLGADGPRTYLLLSLNSAELRAQGGIVGAVAVLQVRDGAVGLVGQSSTADLPERDSSVLPLTDEELTLYTDRLGRWVQDTVMTPDFPRAAELASAFWTDATGQSVDGVLATDPVVVADLLAATGRGIEVDGQQLDASSLLSTLLRDTYLENGDPRDGDAFYAQVAAAVFGLVGDAVDDPATARAAAGALVDAVGERRVHAWSAHTDEQSALAGSPLGGAFLTDASAATTGAVGVFLDDGTAGKLDYDLTATVSVTMAGCGTASPTATITVDLVYDPPDDVAELPAQVVGDGSSGLPTGWLATNLSVYSAVGAQTPEVRRDGLVVGGLTGTADGRSVAVLASRLAPGGQETWTVTVSAPDGALTVWTTPTLTGPGSVSATCGTAG